MGRGAAELLQRTAAGQAPVRGGLRGEGVRRHGEEQGQGEIMQSLDVLTRNVCQLSGASAGDSGTWRCELESYVLGAARGEAGTGEVAVEVEEVNTTTTAATTTTTQPSAETSISNHTAATEKLNPNILTTLTEATAGDNNTTTPTAFRSTTATTTAGTTTTTTAVQTTSQILAREGKSLENIGMTIKREDEEEKLILPLFVWNPHRIPFVILTAAVATLLLLLPFLVCIVFCRQDRRMSYSVEDQEEAEDTSRIEKDWNVFVPETLKWLHEA